MIEESNPIVCNFTEHDASISVCLTVCLSSFSHPPTIP